MRKMICMLLTVLLLTGLLATASAEKGLETLYELYCQEDVFGEPAAVYDQENDEGVRVCFAIFLFDTENDMTTAILIGENGEKENKYYQWITDYEPGATIMTFLLSQYANLKVICEKDVDFCVAFSFDSGEHMTEINSAEDAESFLENLQAQEQVKK